MPEFGHQPIKSPIINSKGEGFLPVSATNRPGFGKKNFTDPVTDSIAQALENIPKTARGSRSKPSILRYPNDIGTGELPHIIQLKAFWRFEPRDIKEKVLRAQKETEKTIGDMKTLSGLISNDNLNPGMIERSGLEGEQIVALKDMLEDKNLMKLVDPSSNDTLGSLLRTNPNKAKSIIETTVKSYQSRLSDIQSDLTNGIGKIGLDEQERLVALGRMNENIERTTVGKSARSGAIGGLVAGAGVGLAVGNLPGAVIGGAAGLVTGAVVLPLAGAVAKAFKNDAVYDQMVSIYLPFCSKINNEDTFQYDETDQSIIQGVADFANAPGQAIAQVGTVVAGKLAGDVGLGGAVAAGTGKVTNPRLEKLFKQKDFRSFNLGWEFYPRNQQEVDNLRDIIETLRYQAHPARDSDTDSASEGSKAEIVLRVPAEFEIRFLSTNPNPNTSGFVENEFLPKIARCALVSVSVDYTPNSIYSSFVDNSPTAVSMNLSFNEMGLITREDISKGF